MYRSGKAQLARRDFYFEHILGTWRWVMFPVRHPRLWWFSFHLDMHYALGWPKPLTDIERGRFHA
jgi:hypothetical protein